MGVEASVSKNEVSQGALSELQSGPEEPNWSQLLDDDLDVQIARDHWAILSREVKDQGRLDIVTGQQVKRLVLFYVLFEIASRHIFNEGAVKKARRTRVPQYNPWFTVMKDATTMAIAAEKELMVTPRRKVMNGQRPKTAKGRQPRAADAYLSRPHRLKSSLNG